MENKRLNDAEWLFTVLTALVKRNGGELRILEEELLEVSKKDFVGLYWDKPNSSILLKLVGPGDLGATKPKDNLEN
jgi:hypothetical protein